MRLKIGLALCLLGLWGGPGRATGTVSTGTVSIPTEPVSMAAFDQDGLQAAVFFFLPEIQFGATQAARGRSFGPHNFTDGSGTDIPFQAGCVVPGDPTDHDGDGIAAKTTTTFDCPEGPLFLTPVVGHWTVTDLDDTDPYSGFSVSGQDISDLTSTFTMNTAHTFQFELDPLRGATYRADLNVRVQDVRASPVVTFGQLRRLNLAVLRYPDADGQGVRLSLKGETSLADDMLLRHPHGVAQLSGELHYSARCGQAGGIDAGTLNFSSGTLTVPSSGSGTVSSTQTTTGAGVTVSGDGLGVSLGYSSTTTSVTATSTLSPELASMLARMTSRLLTVSQTVTYTGCGQYASSGPGP